MSIDEIYDKFIEQYKDYPQQLSELIASQRHLLPQNHEDENYNLGTMKRDDDIGLSSNIAIINAHSFEKSFNDYRQNNPQMPEMEAKARVVFDFLNEHGVNNFSYEQNKDDVLFKDDKGNTITRENFYANAVYNNALTNTNFFDRNVGHIQLLCLEPKDITDAPRNVTGLPQEDMDKFMNIPDEERLQILYKRGLYHESIHMAMGTTDERKCDAFALLKTMKEHPEYAKTIFNVYNIQRSKIGYTISTMHKKNGAQKQQAVKGGAVTYLMPNTYKKLEKYALNPQLIPQTESEILKLTCDLTSEPEFSKEQLSAFADLVAQEHITSQSLADNKIVQACMAQGGFDDINKYIDSDKKLKVFMSDNSTEQNMADKFAKAYQKINQHRSISPQTKTISELRGISAPVKAPFKPRQTNVDINTLKVYTSSKQNG